MEFYIKKIIKLSSYLMVFVLVSFLGFLGVNKKNGDYTIYKASADVPYSQGGYGGGGDDGGGGDGGGGDDDCDGDADGDDCGDDA